MKVQIVSKKLTPTELGVDIRNSTSEDSFLNDLIEEVKGDEGIIIE